MKFEDLEKPIGKTEFFKWKEALYLPRWDIYAVPKNQEVITSIREVVHVLESIRAMFNKPIMITSFYRPATYNKLIGGSTLSSHIFGKAVDFVIPGIASDSVREAIKPRLVELNIRMEEGTPHVHIDTNCDINMSFEQRIFFIPRRG